MFSENARKTLSEVICDRIADHGVDVEGNFDAAVVYLAQLASISQQKANDLLWGVETQLDEEELSNLADALGLLRGILACLLVPVSREVADANLAELIRSPYLHVDECSSCAALSEQIEMRDELDDDQILELMQNLLAHVIAFEEDEEILEDILAGDGDFLDELGLSHGDARQAELVRLFNLMSEEQRDRLMAFAYSEVAGGEAERARSQLAALTVLRNTRLTPLARRALDALAASETGKMGMDALREQLGLGSRRSLGQLQRTVRRAVQALREDGLVLEDEVLIVRRQGREVVFELAAELVPLWRGLMRAEHTPHLSG